MTALADNPTPALPVETSRWPRLRHRMRTRVSHLPVVASHDRALQRDVCFTRALLGTAAGLLGGLPLGGLLGHLVPVLWIGHDGWWLDGLNLGLLGGSCCGLAAGLATLISRRWWVRVPLVTAAGTALGAWLAHSYGLAGPGAAAGAIHGLAMCGLVGITRRVQIRRRSRSLAGHAAALCGDGPEPATAEVERIRCRVRASGRRLLAIRYLLPALAGGTILGNSLLVGGFGVLSVPTALAVGLLLGLPVSIPLALLYRRSRRRALRGQLAAMPREQRLAALVALDDPELPGTCEIVRPLLRDLGIATELSPAAAPTGRGSEPTGA